MRDGMSTKVKILTGVGALILICCLIGVIALISLRGVGRYHQTANNNLMNSMEFLNRIIDHLNWNKTLSEIVFQKKKHDIQTDSNRCKLGKWYNEYIKSEEFNKLPEEMKKKFNSLDEPHRRLHATAASIQDMMKRKNVKAAEREYNEESHRYLAEVQKIIYSINDDLHKASKENQKSEESYAGWINLVVILTLSMGLALGLFILFLSFKAMKVLDKVKPFNDIFSRSALGDLTVDYPIKSVNCSAIMKCGKKDCPDYGKDGVLCWFDVGSYAP